MKKDRKKRRAKNTIKRSNQPTTQGIIHVHSKGFAFVSPEDSDQYPIDIFIPKHLKGSAVDGDLVEVAIQLHKRNDKGPEGAVIHVLKRAKETLVGTVWLINPKGHYILYVQSLGTSKNALVKKQQGVCYQIGDRLLLSVKNWGQDKEPVLCRVTKKLGTIEQPQIDIPTALIDFGLDSTFPKDSLKQLELLSTEVTQEDLKGRENLTADECFTIDPDTAKDFDDALSLTQDEKGHFHLGVHIADVSHYVQENTPLDIEAKRRSNSTYFPGRCIPMLPEELSNHLCSLKENVVRLTLSVFIELDQEGNTLNYNIVRGYIKSRKRFTYKEAKQVLDKQLESPYYETLKRMEHLCLLLRKKRFERGSVDLALPEVVVLVDAIGAPYSCETIEYDITHQLVEEFMLKTNEVVAYDFVKKGSSSIFRIHETPSPENLADFYTLARSLGFPIPETPDASAIQQLFERAKHSPYATQLSIAYVRSMKLAIYSRDNIGHYGLALDHYCHFTSPIRRYSDLVVHRLICQNPNLSAPLSSDELAAISSHCSDKERLSFKAEMHVIQLKKLRLQDYYHQQDPDRIYQGIVTKVKPFGIFFEVLPLQIEGFLHISELEDDYYDFQPQTQTLVGKRRGKIFKNGHPLNLLLEKVDLILMESKWILIQKSDKKSR